MMGDSFYYSLGRAEILLIGRRKRFVIRGSFLLLFTRQVRDTTDWEEKMMDKSWVITITIPDLLCPALPFNRKHLLSGNSNHFVYFSRNHPGSTHGWFLGDSFYYSLGKAEILLIGRRKLWVIPG